MIRISKFGVLVFGLLLGITASLQVKAEEIEGYKAFLEIADADTMVMMPMRDGIRLATDIYTPKNRKEKVPAIFVKTPYNVNKMDSYTLKMAHAAIVNGYAFIVQNERGRYYSEGEWELLGNPRTDGYDALTWLANQAWSNGKIGTMGCSSSAEWQLALAAQNHPAHAAMVPASAGAGIGRVGRFQEQGNWYKGGVHQTLFTIWLYDVQQQQYPRFPAGMSQEDLQRLRKSFDLSADMPDVDWKEHVKTLPLSSWLESAGGNKGPFEDLVSREPNDPRWFKGGLYHDSEDFGVPALWFNAWYDVSQGPNLELFNHIRQHASDEEVRNGQYMVIAPTLHCSFFRFPEYEDLIVGERNMGRVHFDSNTMIMAWFDYWMKGQKNAFKESYPPVTYFTMGANTWQTSEHWPPKRVKPTKMFLSSAGHANSLYGDGTLSFKPQHAADADHYVYDPMNPVPSLGGGVCCNDGISPGGSYDQRGIEARHDVLVYTSSELDENLEVTGYVDITLYVSSDVKDTDFSVKLVDVYPDGTAYNVDDTIQRARYRNGFEKPELMKKGDVYKLKFSPLSTSNLFKKGHRIRVEVSSSKFPQFMRNLNTGAFNPDETESIVANNWVHHSEKYASVIILPVMPEE